MTRTRSLVTEGMHVLGVDHQPIGTVKEVRRADSVVRRPLQPAVCVPCAAIQQLAPEQLVLTLTAAQVDDLWWALAGEDVVISLSGSYD